MKCPGFEQLIDAIDAVTPVRGQVNEHLASGCERCTSTTSWYGRVTSIAARDNSLEPPPWVSTRALKIFAAAPTRPSIRKSLGRLVASLIFDSASQPSVAFARSASAAAPRQLLYQASDFSIDLQIESSGSKSGLRGQVLRDGEFVFDSVSGLALTLIRNGKAALSTQTNDKGEFTMKAVKPGLYDLRIDTPEVDITIVGLRLVRK